MSVSGKNSLLATLLRQIAALLDEQAVPFKPNAYRRAAQVVEDLPRDVSEFKNEEELMELPGIGEAIAKKIREFVTTGRMSYLDQLLAEQGGLPAELMMIENLGPKRVRQFQKELGITSIDQLVKAAKEGTLRSLPRMSELMEKKILESAKRVAERNTRFPREEVVDDAGMLTKTILAVSGVDRAEVAGSFRRHKATIGDLDILVVTKNQKKVADAVVKLPIIRDVVAHGERKVSFNLQSGLRVDVRFVDASQWGSALLYFTGDKEHNISLRKRAIERGWKLNEYALTDQQGGVVASREEKDIYEALGLGWIDPAERRGVLPRHSMLPWRKCR